MSKIRNLNQGGEYPLYVEVDDGDIEVTVSPNKPNDTDNSINITSAEDNIVNSMTWLKSNISTLTSGIRDAMDSSKPDEWSLDFNIGFKGEAGIPLITKGEANAALRVNVKWKRSP